MSDLIERFSEIARRDHEEWRDKIPFIKFPASWGIKIIPPFCGAVVRFVAKNARGAEVSVYLDCYETLGFFGGPHWEIYPGPSGENERFAIDDVSTMLKAIAKVKK